MLLYSGSPAAFKAHQSTLKHLGASTYLGADFGLAALYDLALLGAMWSALTGFYHAVALAGTEKIGAVAFAPIAAQWLNGMVASLPEEAREIDEGQYRSEVSTLAVNAAAIGHLVDASGLEASRWTCLARSRRASTAVSPAETVHAASPAWSN
jgi:hypothetical protein